MYFDKYIYINTYIDIFNEYIERMVLQRSLGLIPEALDKAEPPRTSVERTKASGEEWRKIKSKDKKMRK